MSDTENGSAMDVPYVVLVFLEMFADRVKTISVDYSLGDKSVSYRIDLGEQDVPVMA